LYVTNIHTLLHKTYLTTK